jgi:hypothetical protein
MVDFRAQDAIMRSQHNEMTRELERQDSKSENERRTKRSNYGYNGREICQEFGPFLHITTRKQTLEERVEVE